MNVIYVMGRLLKVATAPTAPNPTPTASISTSTSTPAIASPTPTSPPVIQHRLQLAPPGQLGKHHRAVAVPHQVTVLLLLTSWSPPAPSHLLLPSCSCSHPSHLLLLLTSFSPPAHFHLLFTSCSCSTSCFLYLVLQIHFFFSWITLFIEHSEDKLEDGLSLKQVYRAVSTRGETSEPDDHRSGQCSVVLIWPLKHFFVWF